MNDLTENAHCEILRGQIEEISDQLCLAVKGDFSFTIHTQTTEQSVQKLSLLLNFVIDTARRALLEINQNYQEVHESKNSLEALYLQLIKETEERKSLEIKNQTLNNDLIVAARRAGMTDISTSILHNVGNVLNSVNTSATIISDKIKNSKISNLADVAHLIKDHEGDISNFISSTPQGQRLPGYIIKLAEAWNGDKELMVTEMASVEGGIRHIKEIISKQNLLGSALGRTEVLQITDLIEDALMLNKPLYQKSDINIIREFNNTKEVEVDRVKLLQIVTNLVKNGIESITEQNPETKKLILRTQEKDGNYFVIQIVDNGVGISKDNMNKIFSLGFTTKKNGHGFGLHSGAISAQEMGAQFFVESEGPGKGATFSLVLPYEFSRKKENKYD